MSASDLAIMEEFLASLQASDLPALLALMGPDLVVDEGAGLPWGGQHHGPAGFEALIGGIYQDYELVMTDARLADAGGFVVAQMDLTLTSRATGEQLTLPVVELYEIRDGLIRRIDAFYKDTKAVFDMHARAPVESR